MDTKILPALTLILLFDDSTLGNSYYILLTQLCWKYWYVPDGDLSL